MAKKQTPLEKEWAKLEKQETAYLQKRMEKTDSKLNQLLAEKVPAKLQGTLDVAFSKAFWLVFEKGTAVIEKTYKKETLKQDYQINEFAAKVRGNQKSLKAFSKKASGAGTVNLMLSGVSGVGLGLLGIGIPDIVLFTGLMLKSIYEIALHFGFEYQSEEEKRFILLLIRGALAHGEELELLDGEINRSIAERVKMQGTELANRFSDLNDCIMEASAGLSKELLYMKFLQGIPIVGAVGGAYDAIYMKQIVKYAELKYRRRFLEKHRTAGAFGGIMVP